MSCGKGGSAVIDTPTVPSVPANVRLHSATETSLTFQWDAVDGATTYAWQLSQAGAKQQEGKVSGRNVTVSGLTQGTAYAFSVCAGNQAGTSAWSSAVQATTEGSAPTPVGPTVKLLCVDAPLVVEMDFVPSLGNAGLVQLFRSDGTLVDRIDLADLSTVEIREDGCMIPRSQLTAESLYNSFMDALPSGKYYRIVPYTPLRIKDKTLEIKLHSGVLDFDTSYYLTVDESVCGKAVDKGAWSFRTKAAPSGSDLQVAADGSGDFCTVQGALSYAAGKGSDVSIEIGSGKYEELLFVRDVKNLHIKGVSRDATLISYPNNESYCGGSGSSTGTKPTLGRAIGKSGGRGLWLVENCDNLVLENLCIENSFNEPKGQAECLYFNSGNNTHRLTIENCALLSWQDTFLCKGSVWVHNSLVAGHCDYIWGYPSACLFEDCEIRSRAAGYIVQARVPSLSDKGFVFLRCSLTAESGVGDKSMYLARSGGSADYFDQVVFVDCRMDPVIRPEGWLASPAPNPSVPDATSGWREYGSHDASGNSITHSSPYGKLLTADEAQAYSSKAAVLGW